MSITKHSSYKQIHSLLLFKISTTSISTSYRPNISIQMKSPNPIIWPVLFLHITHSANAKSHFTSHSTEIHALHHNKAPHPNKRDFLTCEETYGEGSIPCGGSDSKYCYDPTIGEVSCLFLPCTYCARE